MSTKIRIKDLECLGSCDNSISYRHKEVGLIGVFHNESIEEVVERKRTHIQEGIYGDEFYYVYYTDKWLEKQGSNNKD